MCVCVCVCVSLSLSLSLSLPLSLCLCIFVCCSFVFLAFTRLVVFALSARACGRGVGGRDLGQWGCVCVCVGGGGGLRGGRGVLLTNVLLSNV